MKKLVLLFGCVILVFSFYANQSVKHANRVLKESVVSDVVHVEASVYKQAASGLVGGMSAQGLWAAAQLESSGNPHASHGKYAGLINIGEEEFKKYGPPYGDRMDPLHNLIAANSYAQANADILKKILRRYVSDADKYLSLQQGISGYSDLIRNPSALAIEIRGYDAIIGNIPSGLRKQAERWTCTQFVDYWVNRFNEVANGAPEKDV